MSITLNNVLTLPSMRRAKVLAGHAGLGNIVTSISVLEYSTPTSIQKDLFSRVEFTGGEIVITAFANVADDVDAQCENLKNLCTAGEVGMILYYVGLLMPRVDKRLIDLANELSFPLICMPEKEPSLRYGEVITEVMDAIVRDQIDSATFALDLLEQISQMAAHNRTVENVLRIISDKLRVNLVVADAKHNVLNLVTWPRMLEIPFERWIGKWYSQEGTTPLLVEDSPAVWGYYEEVHFNHTQKLLLFAFSEGRKLKPSLWKQALDGLKVALSLWGEHHDRMDLSELLKAILQDEPIKMRRLGKIYNIDVSALGDTWILHNLGTSDIFSHLPAIRELSRDYARIDICEAYEDNIILFPTGIKGLQDAQEWADALVSYCKEKDLSVVLTRCTALKHTSAVRQAYLDNEGYVRDAIAIFPRRTYFSLQEVEFAKECRLIAEEGESRMASCLEMLEPMSAWRDGEDVLDSLAVYLLDKNSSVTETAAALFVHKNTIKYRLQKAGDCLGFRIGEIPHSQKLMIALAIRRLLTEKAE